MECERWLVCLFQAFPGQLLHQGTATVDPGKRLLVEEHLPWRTRELTTESLLPPSHWQGWGELQPLLLIFELTRSTHRKQVFQFMP